MVVLMLYRNYDPAANINQVSLLDTISPCIACIFGCTDNGLLENGLGELIDIKSFFKYTYF